MALQEPSTGWTSRQSQIISIQLLLVLLVGVTPDARLRAYFVDKLRHTLVILDHRIPAARVMPDDQIVGIIALGGSTARTREAIKLAKLLPQSKLVLTGAAPGDYAIVHEEGLAADRFIPEYQAETTYENALLTKKMLNPKANERWLLVTSAVHMPRAVASFDGVDFAVEAWPIFDVAATDPNIIAVLGHEWLGLIYYRVTGRTRQLFPSQATDVACIAKSIKLGSDSSKSQEAKSRPKPLN